MSLACRVPYRRPYYYHPSSGCSSLRLSSPARLKLCGRWVCLVLVTCTRQHRQGLEVRPNGSQGGCLHDSTQATYCLSTPRRLGITYLGRGPGISRWIRRSPRRSSVQRTVRGTGLSRMYLCWFELFELVYWSEE